MKPDGIEEVTLLAIEVWCSICDEEILRLKDNNPAQPCRKYIEVAYSSLLNILLECLKAKSASDDSDWTIAVASACCISLIAQIIRDPIVDPVLAYIGANLSSPDWKCRDAALLSFAAILKGPDKTKVDTLVRQALPALTASLNDVKNQVKETAAWTFAKIASHYHVALAEAFDSVVKVWIKSLEDKPKISNQICFAIHNLAESLRPSESDNSNKISPYMKELLDALWDNAFRSDAFDEGLNLANSSFAAYSNLVQFAPPDVHLVLAQNMQDLIEEFDTTIHGEFKRKHKTEEYQGYLCSAMQTVFIKMSGKIAPPVTAHVVDIILQSFSMRKAVYEEGIIALSGLISAVGKDFAPYMNAFGPFLVHALNSHEDATLCRIATGCVADLARALEEPFAQYLGQIMPVVMDLLKNPDIDRQIKIVAIATISDIALQTNKYFLPYIREVMETLKSASELALSNPNSDDPELPIYLQQLKETLIESYTGIVFGIKEANEPAALEEYVQGIFTFLLTISSDIDHMDLESLRSICGLIGDIASFLGPRVKMYVAGPQIQNMIKRLDSYGNKDQKNVALWANTSVAKALK